jgi:hypothetical protein
MNDILNDLNSVVRKDAIREALTARACLPQTNTGMLRVNSEPFPIRYRVPKVRRA